MPDAGKLTVGEGKFNHRGTEGTERKMGMGGKIFTAKAAKSAKAGGKGFECRCYRRYISRTEVRGCPQTGFIYTSYR